MLKSKSNQYCSRSSKNYRRTVIPYLKSNVNLEIKRKLDNGVTILGEEVSGNDAAIVLAFPYGLLKHQYISHLTEHLLFRNCISDRKSDIDVQIERLGGWFKGYTESDKMILISKFLAENFNKVGKLICKNLIANNIKEKQLKLEKLIIEGECLENRNYFHSDIDNTQNEAILKGHKLYVPPELLPNIRKVTIEEVLKEKESYFGGNNLYIGITGPNIKELINKTSDIFKNLPKNKNPKHSFKRIKIENSSRTLRGLIADEAEISISIPVCGYESDDRYKIEFLTHNLIGLSDEYCTRSRFWKELRTKRGLMYSRSVSYTPYNGVGILEFFIYGILPKNLQRVKSIISEEIKKVVSSPLREKEFMDTQESLLIGERRSIRDENLEETAERLALSGFYDLPSNHNIYEKKIRSLTPELINKCARNYFGNNGKSIVTIKKG